MDLSRQHTIAQQLFDYANPWEAIPDIATIIQQLSAQLPAGYQELKPGVWVGPGTTLSDYVSIQGPAIIGENCEIRHGAFLRENVILGNGVIVGNSVEVKNAILFDGVEAPHYNYIGDAILGYKAHLGAGAILSNFRSLPGTVKVTLADGSKQDTGLEKFSAIIGDRVEIGAQCVINPGAIIGCNSVIYPLTSFRGYLPADTILKGDGTQVRRK